MKLRPVPSKDFPAWEPQLRWHFDSFAERSGGSWTADDYRRWVNERTAQCWIVTDGPKVMCCALTQTLTDQCRTCELIACAGEDADKWTHLVTGIMGWAKEAGCGKFRAIARPGWKKRLRDFGFRETHVMLDKELA